MDVFLVQKAPRPRFIKNKKLLKNSEVFYKSEKSSGNLSILEVQ